LDESEWEIFAMIQSNISKVVFTILISFSLSILVAPSKSWAEEKPPIITGRVVDQSGEPVVDSTVVLIYMKLRRYGGLDPLYDKTLYPFLRQDPPGFREHLQKPLPDEQALREQPPYIKSVKDGEGNFILTGIVSGTVQLIVIPDNLLEQENPPEEQAPHRQPSLPEIAAIKFGKALFYPHPFPFSPDTGAVTFAIKPGANIQNVEIIMKSGDISPQKIRGKVVFKNGQPLVDKTAKVNIFQLDMNGTNSSNYISTLQTDTNGNFELNVHDYGIYSLTLAYLGQKSLSDLFIVRDRQIYEDLVFTLDIDPSELTDSPPKDNNTENIQRESLNEFPLPLQINFPNVWVVNPENGHAYKAIQCDGTRKDAEAKAKAEGANLVSITSEDEQVWLDVVYEDIWYWIGLKYEPDESQWVWESGEPFSYLNWKMDNISTPGVFVPRGNQAATKDYVIMTTKGRWERVDEGAPGGRTQMAVIEKMD